MSHIVIALLNEPKSEPDRIIEGRSGMAYRFDWFSKRGQYEYKPKSQDETNDIFMTAGPDALFFCVPVLVDGDGAIAASAPPKPKPTVNRRDYDDLDKDMLGALMKDCGLTALGSDDETTRKRLLDAFFLGAGLKALTPPVSAATDEGTPEVPFDDDAPTDPQSKTPAPKRNQSRGGASNLRQNRKQEPAGATA